MRRSNPSCWVRWSIALGAMALVSCAGAARAQPLMFGDSPFIDPLDFRVTTYRSGLNFPTSMQTLGDGSLLVATSNPNGSLFNSTGALVRLADANSDGVADAAPQTLYNGLPGVVTSVRREGSLVFATSSQSGSQRISLLRTGATAADPYSLLGSLNFSFPAGWEHSTYTMTTRPVAGSPGDYELYFNIGSQFNNLTTTGTVGMSGLASGTLAGDSIYRVRVSDTGPAPVVSNLEQIASGLRNAAGMVFQPASGALYFEDNGIDTPGNLSEAFSADELNVIAAGDLGGAVENFGFPDTYIQYRTGAQFGNTGVAPIVAFQPLGPTQSESEGPVEIGLSPAAFPGGLDNGMFVAFHGESGKAGVANGENPLVYYDFARNEYLHFISNDDPSVGSWNGVLSSGNSLFLTDLTSTGSFSAPGTGVIYQIQALPAPIPGDANRDGLVNGADYTAWADHFHQPGNFSKGDFNRDGTVSGADYTLWADHFTPAASAAIPVPEPAAGLLLIVGCVGMVVGALYRRWSHSPFPPAQQGLGVAAGQMRGRHPRAPLRHLSQFSACRALMCVAMSLVTSLAAATPLVLDFGAPVPGTIMDAAGNGTGFTHRLPRTGADIPANDPYLDVTTTPGLLRTTSTHSDINYQQNLGIAVTPALFTTGVGTQDFAVSMMVRGIHVPNGSDQLGIIVGAPNNDTLRVNLHEGEVYIFSRNWSGTSYHDDNSFETGLDSFAPGDDVLLSLTRRGGLWQMAWENITNPAASGQSPAVPLPWLDATPDYYFGISHANAGSQTQMHNQLDYFLVNVGSADVTKLPGDASLDGRVSGADYTIWADHFKTTGATWGQGDFTGDGAVSGADYTVWADHFTPVAASAAIPVPEPAGWLLALVGGTVALGGIGVVSRRVQLPPCNRTTFCAWLVVCSLLFIVLAKPTFAIHPLVPSSYDLPNGETGYLVYHDEAYNGLGDLSVDNAPLSGGVGDLTDGQFGTDWNWFVQEQANPWVGWRQQSTSLTFRFADLVHVTGIELFTLRNSAASVLIPELVTLFSGDEQSLEQVAEFPFSDSQFADGALHTLQIAPNNTGSVHQLVIDSAQWALFTEIRFLGASAGDANLDDLVDGADYTIWADHFKTAGATWGQGDFTGDGAVSGAHNNRWGDHITPAPASAAIPVPEPAGIALCAIAAALLLSAVPRRRARGSD